MKEIKLQVRPLETIEGEINLFKQQTAIGIIEIGKRLIEAKDQVPHGTWEKWLEEKVQIKKSTANNFMRVANEFEDFQAIGDLGQTKIFTLLGIEKEKREDFIKQKHKVNGKAKTVKKMSTRELQKVIKEQKKLEVVNIKFTEQQQLENLLLEQQVIEKELEMKRQQIIDTKKNLILKNELDLELIFEEEVSGDYLVNVDFHMYIVRNNVKQFICKINRYPFEVIKLGDTDDMLYRFVYDNKNLVKEEVDFIMKKCYELKDTIIARDRVLRDERKAENDRKMFKEAFESMNIEKIKETKEHSDLKKEFIDAGYRALAKKYHPDVNNGNDDTFKAIAFLKDSLLKQNGLSN